MTALPPWLRRFLIGLAGLVLALGLTAGLLAAAASATAEYMPLFRAASGVAALGVGYLLGLALHPLARWRPPVPPSAEVAASPRGSLGRAWLRGIAAGFWLLALLGTALALLSRLLMMSVGFGPWSGILIPLLVLATALLVPLVIARSMVAGGEGLPRWTFAAAAANGFIGSLGLLLVTWYLVALTGPFPSGVASSISDLMNLMTLAIVPVIVAATPVLARDVRPSLRGPVWSLLLALLALGGAWLLHTMLTVLTGPFGSAAQWLWSLLAAVLWGGSFGALLPIAIARWRAERSRAGAGSTQRTSRLALAAGGFGLLLLGLFPLAVWLATIALPGLTGAPPPSTTPIGAANGFPNVTQPGLLPILGPTPLSPTAGATLTGQLWSFTWRPPSGVTPGELYQFALWPPGAARPATQLVIPSAGLGISSMVARGSPSLSGPWVWRVRVVRPGQGAGQWSQAQPFTPR